MALNKNQIIFLESKGLTTEIVDTQINLFKQGTHYLKIIKPAQLNNGIKIFSKNKISHIENNYSQLIESKKLSKFVPASGAATRMFKDLYTFLTSGETSEFVVNFIENIEKFAFYNELVNTLKNSELDVNQLITEKKYKEIIETLLLSNFMDYGSLPKGLLTFHRIDNNFSTPITEHIKEAMLYGGNNVDLIFTISEEYQSKFKKEIESSSKKLQVEKLKYTLTYQKSRTNTIAVSKDFELVELDNDELLIRPGGHGSLIENLNEVDSDIIFIKNIDNVCADKYINETVKYKKLLTSELLRVQNKVFEYVTELKDYNGENNEFNAELYNFIKNELGCYIDDFSKMTIEETLMYFNTKLNRPIRVCGMVKNEGEPGGGPFWVKNKEGVISLQIVESAQINQKDKKQVSVFKSSSHFNPVDLVCAVKDIEGKKYDLTEFVDKDAYFIAKKTYQGEEILALEHPGLWNGGMGEWSTVFVEVSSLTFNPVKTVNDLLRTAHQN